LVRLCTCPEAAECVRHAGFERVPACKLECAPAHLEAYVRGGGDAEPLAGCFEDARVDARALNRCVREHVDSMCGFEWN
jgi:hypothetical protein